MTDLRTISPDELPELSEIPEDLRAVVFSPSGPLQSVPYQKLLPRLIAANLALPTKAALDADLAHDADSVALVFNDPTPALNGWYRKVGASGAGAWQQFEELAKAVRLAAEAAAVAAGDFADAASGFADDAEAAAASVSLAGILPEADALPVLENLVGIELLPVVVDGMPKAISAYRLAQYINSNPPAPALHALFAIGQSLNGGGAEGATHIVEPLPDVVAFPRQTLNPPAFLPAVATSDAVTGVSGFGAGYPMGDMPMFGFAKYLIEMIAARTGQSLAAADRSLLIACHATGGSTLATNSKGGVQGGISNFAGVLSQVQAAKDLAPGIDRALRTVSLHLELGESDADNGMTYAAFKAGLVNLRNQYQTDIAAILPGAVVKMFISQTSSRSNNPDIARAQFDAAMENPGTIILVGPQHQFEYYDAFHPVGRDALWAGAYVALAWEREVILDQRWQPLHFAFDSRSGNQVTLRSVGRTGSLVIDETTIPAQTAGNMVRGFTARTSAGVVVPVSAVSLVGTDLVRVDLANYASGHRIRIGLDPGVPRPSAQETGGTAPYTGGACNIRDSLGETIPIFEGNEVNRPMHNWAAGQEIVLP